MNKKTLHKINNCHTKYFLRLSSKITNRFLEFFSNASCVKRLRLSYGHNSTESFARLDGSSPTVVNWRDKLQSHIYLSVGPRVGFEPTTSGIDHCSADWNIGSEGRKAFGMLKTSCPNWRGSPTLAQQNHGQPRQIQSLQISASYRTFNGQI